METMAFAGGKGGTGKTFITSSIALILASKGGRVIAVDADLGGANLHTFLGKNYPEKSLADFLLKRSPSLNDILIDTPVRNLKMICGASDIFSLANPHYSQKMKLMRNMLKMESDYLILDLGAGSNLNVLDFFGMADKKIVVVTSEPTSIQNAYGFIKLTLFRKIFKRLKESTGIDAKVLKREIKESAGGIKGIMRVMDGIDLMGADIIKEELENFRCGIVVNMAESPVDGKVAKILNTIVKGFLNIHLDFFGSIPADGRIGISVERVAPYILAYPVSEVTTSLYRIADRILARE